MNRNSETFVRRAHQGRSGQALIIVAFSLVMLLGFTGFVIDVGHLYYAHRELQASTDAAALAGAQALPNPSWAAAATAYSAVTGGVNANPNLPNVTMTANNPAAECSSTLQGWGIACAPPSGYNLVRVEQQATVPLNFMGIIGASTFTIKAISYAAMRGAARAPYNVAIIVDTTQSMNSTENEPNCSTTRIACALQGIRVFLSDLSPCGASLSSCGAASSNPPGGANVANPVDSVSLYTFPPVSTATASSDYTCSGSPTVMKYDTTGTGHFLPAGSTYQIINFSSDYRTSDTATSLNASSNLVDAAGGKSGCLGMKAVGGVGTYYAQAIYTVQRDLVAYQALRPNTQNVMIILSDADATATSANMPGSNTSGTYPSSKQECGQAVTAATAAKNATPPTRVYTVAYGSASSGCATDTNPAITPCQTMQQMATSSTTFYSDYASSQNKNQCVSAAQPTSSLTQIFTEIAGDLTVSRLTPGSIW